MYQFIYGLFLIPLLLYGAYFMITGLFIFKKNKYKIGHYDPKYKLAILIACRNEEKVITNLIKSLLKQDYPKDLYEIFVIPNNCTDNTEKVAKKAGAKIIKCKQKVSSKGEVLKYTFSYLTDKEYDAYLIFDADNIVAPNFLSRMNDTLCEGYEVAQGFRDSKNACDNWISGGYSLFYWGQNAFFSKARMHMNSSASINGTGFMIKKSALQEIGFNTVTMTEDVEFSVICALNNKKIMFVEDAKTYDEQPLAFKTSWKQRQRWTMGNYQCLANYAGKLLKQAWKEKSLPCLDMALFLIAPIVQVIFFFLGVSLLIYQLSDIKLTEILQYIFSYRFLLTILTYVISVGFAIFIVLYNKKKIKKIISGILGYPIFILSWVPINIICLFKKNIFSETRFLRS
jgi:cellulose synthase/poly-beta-1,6-N-acetylglucosamine synthase-like glycosyltransferase